MADLESWGRVSAHFVQRAVERLGCSEDEAHLLGQRLLWAVRDERYDIVQFVTRVNREGARVFRFCHTPTQRTGYALIDTNRFVCITVLPAGIVVPRQNKGRLRLKEEDL